MKRIVFGLALTLAMVLGGVGQAKAGIVTSFHNTGVDAGGNVLADGVTDTNYSLSLAADGSTYARAKTSASGFPVLPDAWLLDNKISRWIMPSGSYPGTPVKDGEYDYKTTFDLTGFNPATAQIVGQWASDNEGLDILINGISTGNTIPISNGDAFHLYHPFSITSGFKEGLNTLTFRVYNDGNVTGVRVEGTATATATAVPEPASMTMLGIGLVSLVGYGLRRRKQAPEAT
jgi:PEP-CTERM motif